MMTADQVYNLRIQIIEAGQFERFFDPKRKLNVGEPTKTHDPNGTMFDWHKNRRLEALKQLDEYRKINPDCPELKRDIVSS